MKKILLVGDALGGHMYRFVKHLSENMNDVAIDIFNIMPNSTISPIEKELRKKIYYIKRRFPNFFYSIPRVRTWAVDYDYRRQLKEIESQAYDIVNVHYISRECTFVSKEFHRIGRKLILTPYGSDVLRADAKDIKRIKKIAEESDGIALSPNRETGFYNKVLDVLEISPEKIMEAGFGSDMIDELNRNEALTKENAKKQLGIDGYFTITIGYNGSSAQQHEKVIDEIFKIKDKLPKKTMLLFPMTYPSENKSYIYQIKKVTEEKGFAYKVYSDFMELKDLVYLRKCSDVFIHAQLTDASCASIMEYFLAGSQVINGNWLRYPELEQFGMPYSVFQHFDEISILLLEMIENPRESPEGFMKFLKQRGWEEEIKYWVDLYEKL